MRLDAVFEAARAGDVEVVRAALSTDPTIVDARGENAFYIACRNGHFSVAAFLLERGADVNACGYFGAPARHWAATNGHRDVVEWLLACGADRSILDPRFEASPSGWAREGGHEELAAWMEEVAA